jgi:hypothetical protein
MREIDITRIPKSRNGPNEYWEVAIGVTCVRLGKGRFALVDSVDWERLKQYKWHPQQ